MENTKKKVLVITYYWFPFTGTGTYRITRIVKHLIQNGWEPIILTPQHAAVPVKKEDLHPIYRNVKTYRSRILEPTFLFKKDKNSSEKMTNASFFLAKKLTIKQRIIRWVRLNLFIPDAKILWYPFAVNKGKKIIRAEKPDVILSTSPPPTTQLIARKLAKWSKLSWIADFRDPWTNIYYYESLRICPISKKINKILERKVLNEADQVITVSDNFFPDYQFKEKHIQLTNGYDKDDVKDIHIATPKNKAFTIQYVGSLKTNQFFKNFLHVLQALNKEPYYQNRIKLKIAGYVDPSIQEYINKELNDISITIQGYLTHKEALKQMLQADLLILAIGKGKKSINVISTKLFEYLMVNKPILAFGNTEGSANRILADTNAGVMFSYDAQDEVKKYLLQHYKDWSNNVNNFHPNHDTIKKYSFSQITKQLTHIMEAHINLRKQRK